MTLTRFSLQRTRLQLIEAAFLFERKAVKKALPDAEPNYQEALTQLRLGGDAMEDFVRHADDPLGALEKLVEAITPVAKKHDEGKPITGADLADVSSLLTKLNDDFGAVYGPFVNARTAIYAAAKAAGVATKRPSKKVVAEKLEDKDATQIADKMDTIVSRLASGMKRLQDQGVRMRDKIRKATSDMEKHQENWKDLANGAVDAFLDFRDSVGTEFFQNLKGVERRVNELDGRFEPTQPGAPAIMKEIPPPAAKAA